jgi:hypothetical protein
MEANQNADKKPATRIGTASRSQPQFDRSAGAISTSATVIICNSRIPGMNFNIIDISTFENKI